MTRAKSSKSKTKSTKTKSTKPKFELLYEEKYFARQIWVPEYSLPTIAALPHLHPDLHVRAIEIKASGSCLLDGKELEYQDVRIYVSLNKDDKK